MEAHFASWIINGSLGVYALSLLLPMGLRSLRARWSRDGFLLIAFMVVLELLGHGQAEAVAGLGLVGGSVWMLIRSRRISVRLRAAWLRRWRDQAGLVVNAPFRGRWKASGCGPDPAKNHHFAATDQWFAIDWVRVDGETRGAELFSPVDGVVAHVEDGHPDIPAQRWLRKPNRLSPAGNYVSIQLGLAEGSLAFVLLCHLQEGSVRVAAGESVRAGSLVGLCGNSGNTTIPHLHIHAQDRAEVAIGRAKGVPLRFRGEVGEDWIVPGRIIEA
jgi:hypothetical protein